MNIPTIKPLCIKRLSLIKKDTIKQRMEIMPRISHKVRASILGVVNYLIYTQVRISPMPQFMG
jgi:hypothetical protein